MAVSKSASRKSTAKTTSKSKSAVTAKAKSAARSKARAGKTPAIVRASGIEKHSPNIQLLVIVFSLLALIFLALANYRYS